MEEAILFLFKELSQKKIRSGLTKIFFTNLYGNLWQRLLQMIVFPAMPAKSIAQTMQFTMQAILGFWVVNLTIH